MTPTLRVRDPQELLALIPFQLGFQPRESAVVVSLREPQRRVGLVMRVDLADLAQPDDGRQVARTMVTHVAADGGRDTVLVLYTDAPVPPVHDAGSSVWRAAGHYLGAAEAFLGSVDAWVVSSTGYASLGCPDLRCCPTGGRPLSDLAATVVGAEMVLAGAVVMASRDELARIPRASDLARRRANAAANRWRQRASGAGPAERQQWRLAGFAAWRAALDGDMTPATLGRIEVALDDIIVRDAVLLSLVPGTGDLAEQYLLGAAVQSATQPADRSGGVSRRTDGRPDGRPDGGASGGTAGGAGSGPGGRGRDPRWTDVAVGRAMAAIVDPGVGVPPADELTSAALRTLEGVVSHGRRRHQAPALTLLALLTWWRGSTARSGALLERAQACDPSYRLARLLDRALEAGMAPGWARRTAR